MPSQRIRIDTNVPARMRDGITLYSDIYRPDTSEPCPVIITRTPYGKSPWVRNLWFSPLRAAQSGYAMIVQDCRGCWASEGEFDPYGNEVDDGYDTVEWAAAQPWSNGKVGMVGGSYQGFTQWTAALKRPPHLGAIVPGVIGMDIREHEFPGGAALLEFPMLLSLFLFGLSDSVRAKMPLEQLLRFRDGLLHISSHWDEELARLPLGARSWEPDVPTGRFFLDSLERADDPDFWRSRRVDDYGAYTVPAFHITSWYDLCQAGALRAYIGMKEHGGSEFVRRNQKLVVGPWYHGGLLLNDIGELNTGLGSAGAMIDLEGQQLRWLDHWLRGAKNGIADEPPVRIFVMGDNIWRWEQEWPLARTQYTPYYLSSSGRANSLRGDGALTPVAPGDQPYDTFVYDPRNPVPTKGGAIIRSPQSAALVGAHDQRDVEARADVLVFTTPPLDRDLEVTGPIVVKLYASSSAVDTDFTAKLVDVWPDGRALNMADGIIRARYREPGKVSMIEPGAVVEYTMDLWATSNVWKAGHRIRVDISSSNFPRFTRNLNTGRSIVDDAEIGVALQKVFHDARYPSHILLPVVPR